MNPAKKKPFFMKKGKGDEKTEEKGSSKKSARERFKEMIAKKKGKDCDKD